MNKFASLIGQKLAKQVKNQQMHDLLEAEPQLGQEITSLV